MSSDTSIVQHFHAWNISIPSVDRFRAAEETLSPLQNYAADDVQAVAVSAWAAGAPLIRQLRRSHIHTAWDSHSHMQPVTQHGHR